METVENGKVDLKAVYPARLKGMNGSYELTGLALGAGFTPMQILEEALFPAMKKVGKDFSEKKIFVPQMLMAAKAMGASMVQLKPYLLSGDIRPKGTVIMATVKGDLHDIGKNLVSIMIEGGGWKVIDLGVDVSSERIIKAIEENPGSLVGLSTLLTATMENMKRSVIQIKERYPETKILIGGAPVHDRFCKITGADFYSPDPWRAVRFLSEIAS